MTRSVLVKSGPILQAGEDAVVVFRYQDGALPDAFAAVAKALGPSWSAALKGAGFEGKRGQAVLIHTGGRIRPRIVIAAGLGPRDEAGPELVRQAGGRAVKHAREAGCERVAFHLGISGRIGELARACVEGAQMALYRFTRLKTGDANGGRDVKSLVLYVEPSDVAAAKSGAAVGEIVADGVNEARELGHLPANVVTPTHLADRARTIAKRYGLSIDVIDRRGMERLRMGALLGVAQGTEEPPKFIVLRYDGSGRDPGAAPIALVGKSITFDSGGISLKPSEKMEQMKSDMMGGAGVLSALEAVARLRLPLSVIGLLPATENLPSGRALKPGDVVTALSGTTIEVINTDAEGRLVLADALAYAVQRYHPRLIVDIATLTGACAIALGEHAIGLLGTDESLLDRLRRAGDESGERVWPLPLWDEYHEMIKSDVADLKNTGGRAAGTITAAAFLSKFVEKTPWAHLDIAGAMWSDRAHHYVTKGPTGSGVRVLVQFLMDEASGVRPARRIRRDTRGKPRPKRAAARR